MNNKWKKELEKAVKKMARNKAFIESNSRVTKSYKTNTWRLGDSPSSMKNPKT